MSVRGWVYVFTTESMLGLLKVGYSLKDPILRARELENAGLPHPYVVEYEVFVCEPLEIEQCTHKELKDFREAKEWFRCSIGEAISAIRKVIGSGEILLEKIIGDIESTIGRDSRFIAYDNRTVLDTNTNLMWASNDNGSDINWNNAMAYCRNHNRGGYSDWRLPKLKELEELYTSDGYEDKIKIINGLVWAEETRGARLGFSTGCEWCGEAAYFNFGSGGQYYGYRSIDRSCRALPVRSVK
jgi:hypothetical protein